MDSTRKNALAAGIFFIVAAVTAIVGFALYGPVLDDPGYIADATRSDTSVLLGALFEVALAISVIGTGIALFPVIRRHSESLGLAYAVGRTLEATIIAAGIVSLLSIVTLRQAGAGDVALGQALVAFHDWTFLLGPGFAIGVNTSVLAFLMYRSQLVPRAIAVLGLVGGPVIFASSAAVLFGAYEQMSTVGGLIAFPVFAWEMSLAVWLIAKGFRQAPAAAHAPRVAMAAA
jgi:hypothetical protein